MKKIFSTLCFILSIIFQFVAIVGIVIAAFWSHDTFNYPGLIGFICYFCAIICFLGGMKI